MTKLEIVQIANKQNKMKNNEKKKENFLLNYFCFYNKLEKNWHKRLDANDDDIIFKKLMNRIILLFEIFVHQHIKIIQMLILQKKRK